MAIKENPLDICKDIDRLQPEMKIAVNLLAKTMDFRIVETFRSQERQQKLFETGSSKTLNSRHKIGMAIDIYPLPNGYQSGPEYFSKLHETWRRIAVDVGYPHTKCLDWDQCHLSLNDGKHI